jgi:hypothetical protein
MCAFCQRGRIWNLQMQRCYSRMNKVTTAKRPCDRSKTAEFHAKFNRQAVAFAEVAIKDRD